MKFDASFFVALSFVLVILGFIRLKLPSKVAGMLDERAENIKNELDEARALRQEAMDLLADYEKRAKEAEQEASALVKQAEEDAKRIAAEAEIALQERLERRTAQAEEKIARAEAQLSQEVRRATVNLAINAAAALIADNLSASQSKKLVDETISGLAKSLH